MDWRHQTRNGEVFDVEVVSQPITHQGRAAHFVVATDVTEPRRVQEALFDSRRRLQALFDNAMDAMVLLNNDSQFVDANPAACGLFGRHRDDMLRMHVWDVDLDDPDVMRRQWQTLLRMGHLSGDSEFRSADGVPRRIEFRAVADVLPGLHLVVMRDVTDRNRVPGEAENLLRESHERLRRVSARARARREEDRTRVARELHDQLGQALAGLKIDLCWLGDHASDRRTPDEDVADKIGAMTRLVDDTIWRVRRISSELRPPVLDKLGLIAAIEWQADEFAQRSGMRVRVRSRMEHVELDRGRSTSVFRMFQESLTNVAAHARATSVTVTLARAHGRLTLTVADDGVGVSLEDLASASSLGLVGMRERAGLLDGTVTVARRRPHGTVVAIAIPLGERRKTPRDDGS